MVKINRDVSSIKYQPAEGWHFKTPKEWQDYSIEINTEENPVRGDRTMIEKSNNGSVTAFSGL